MGADVIKIEPPWGEPWRLTQRFTPTESRTFMVYNRGKRSLPLDLTKSESHEILSRLLPRIDVALVNYRPDVAAKLGVDYETLSAINPRLVYCELTAYGRQGPDAHRPRLRYDYPGNDGNDCLGNQNCGQRSILGLVQPAN